MLGLLDYRCVITLCEERHFGRAAKRLKITQPALTARLQRIETMLEARLFIRSRSGVEPTDAGLAFVEGAQHVLDAAMKATEAVRNAQHGFGQTLRIGMTQIAAYQIVSRCLAGFRKINPGVCIRLIEGTTAALETQLEQRQIDAAFLHPPLHAADLSERLLVKCRLNRFNAIDNGDAHCAIYYPRSEAPVLMSTIGRHEEAAGQRPSRVVEADTLLGAIVLSEAGYGSFVAPVDAPYPLIARQDQSKIAAKSYGNLETSLAWRTLDRRPVLQSLIESTNGLTEI